MVCYIGNMTDKGWHVGRMHVDVGNGKMSTWLHDGGIGANSCRLCSSKLFYRGRNVRFATIFNVSVTMNVTACDVRVTH